MILKNSFINYILKLNIFNMIYNIKILQDQNSKLRKNRMRYL